ncbi:MAG: hypothetical protein SF182_09420 [Deltaproteobacteria bacterium]|nr:hypothetical protein [Deltaproteobacteria bacterium]
MENRIDVRPALLIALALIAGPSWCTAADSFISRNARAPEAMVYTHDEAAAGTPSPDPAQTPTPPAADGRP